MASSFRTVSVAMAMAALVVTACADGPPRPSAEELQAAHQDSIQMASTVYDPAAFDTLTWENTAARHDRGAVVFSISCSKCHGLEGLGDGGFVQRGDTLKPPSFIEPDWPFAADIDGLRQQIFTGTTDGMPHWGLHGLKYRDVDAAAAYITEVLRSQ